MKIRNGNLANETLKLRDGTDVKGDADGVFEVPEDVGQLLLSTKGWSAVRKARELDEVVTQPPEVVTAPVKKPLAPPAPDDGSKREAKTEETPKPEAAVEPKPSEEPKTEASAEGAGGNTEEGPDLSEMTGPQLLDVAQQYGIEVPSKVRKGKVDDLRAFVDNALYGPADGESADANESEGDPEGDSDEDTSGDGEAG